MTIMNMIGRIVTRIILLISLSEIFISYAVLASEISVKSISKQAKQRINVPTVFEGGASQSKLQSHSNLVNRTNESTNWAVPSSLMYDIISVTQAEPDLRLKWYHYLSEMLEQHLFSSHQNTGLLRGQWRCLWRDHLKAPENLIYKNEIKEFLANPYSLLDEGRDIFVSFNFMYKALNKYERELCSFIIEHDIPILPLDTIKDAFQSIRQQYQAFKDTLIELVNEYSKAIRQKDEIKFCAYRKQIEAHLEPKATLMSDIQPGSFYRISQETALQILAFDERGNRQERQAGQNHHVSYIPPKDTIPNEAEDGGGVYFKNDGNPPLQPGREAMVYHLYSILNIPTAQPGLIFIDNIKLHSDEINDEYFKGGRNIYPFCVQASREIKGERGDTFLNRSYLELTDVIDYTSYFWQTLGALLCYPGDGKAENSIAKKLKGFHDKYELLSIDNDSVFEPPTHKGYINLKSVVFALPQIDYPVEPRIKKLISKLDP
ncbi:hypothetical protein H0W26_00375, partial [Candidatus Dependentiae bacterium]|nr:hypothetical protein [Candidatus Dependentiae bacterium]